MALARLDHVIFEVPSIRAAHAELASRFPEAWPIGPFWPGRLTSGIALGGLNLELVESLDDPVEASFGKTLVFEPRTLEAARDAFLLAGLPFQFFEKTEEDSGLLRLRGFPEPACRTAQPICTNLYYGNAEALPFDFFVCDYAPWLKERLSPSHTRLTTGSHVLRVVYATPDPIRAETLLIQLGFEGDVPIEFTYGPTKRIQRIETNIGPVSPIA